MLTDLNAREIAAVRFDAYVSRPEVVDVDGDGRCEFLDRGSGWQSAGLLGSDGEVLWSLDSVTGVDDIAAGDLDGDGILEFVVGWNGADGLWRHDSRGRVLWRTPDDNVWSVAIVDVDGDGRQEIVHTNGRNAVPAARGSGERLLVGCRGSVLDFSMGRPDA